MTSIDRRNFIKTSMMGGLAASCLSGVSSFPVFASREKSAAQVSLTTGDNRADLVFRALLPFSKQIKLAIGNRRVILKPNVVSTTIPLASTHVDTLEGVMEFLKSIKKSENVIIAETSAKESTIEGFDNFGYTRLISKYQVKFVDLDNEPFEVLYVLDEKDFKPHALRISRVLLDPDSYLISVSRLKTHSGVIATLSLKNIILGSPLKDIGFSGSKPKQGTKNDKAVMHGGGFRGLNYNIYSLACRFHPHLAVIDGFEGMEGTGPLYGTPVDHRICVAGTDWLAADRVGVELMGIDFSKIGYLNYCTQAGLGVSDLSRIEIIGERLTDHIKTYKLADNYEKQLIWMTPVS